MGISLEQALKRCDLRGGSVRSPFCAVGRLSAHFNASSASWDGLSIRRREVFKGFERRKPESYQAHRKAKPAEFQRVLCIYLGPEMKLNLLGLVS